jgi:PII-like signaling protein
MKLGKNAQAVLLRIYIGESDQYEGKPLYHYLVELFRKEGFYGTTVLRGITGFGKTSRIHTHSILRLSADLPVIVEVVDSREKIEEIKPVLEKIIVGGLVTEEEVTVCFYHGDDEEKE